LVERRKFGILDVALVSSGEKGKSLYIRNLAMIDRSRGSGHPHQYPNIIVYILQENLCGHLTLQYYAVSPKIPSNSRSKLCISSKAWAYALKSIWLKNICTTLSFRGGMKLERSTPTFAPIRHSCCDYLTLRVSIRRVAAFNMSDLSLQELPRETLMQIENTSGVADSHKRCD